MVKKRAHPPSTLGFCSNPATCPQAPAPLQPIAMFKHSPFSGTSLLSKATRRHALAACVASLAAIGIPAHTASPTGWAGEIVFVAGAAHRSAGNEKPQAVVKGAFIYQGDILRTQANAHVYVRMADGGLLVLRPQSRLSVDTWKFDPNAPALSEIKYTLTEGVTRYVSGKGAQAAKESFRLNTPLAAIGVRGTDFTALAGADITLVSVRSGGVVVGAFGTGCTPESAGPCSGDKTAELFATRDSDKLLQVRRGDVVPRLIDATLTNSPEKVRPAAPGEPVATGIDPFKSAEIPKPGALASLAALPNSASDEAIDFAAWGRWGTLTASEGAEVVKSLVQGRNLVAINRYYAIATNPTSSLELPSAGVGQFRLVSHDGLLIDPSTGAVSTTNVTDGALRVDFGARRFNTNLNLTTSRIATSVQSSGYIEPSGRLSSDAYVSATVVDGALGGGPASQAIYTYRRLASGQVPEVSGVASWRRGVDTPATAVS